MVSAQDFKTLKLQTLQHFWGHNRFRETQEEVIDTVIGGQDAVVLLPTGGGKSLCYQLPALLLAGTCLVISPLLALMKDQVYHLRSRGIEADFLSSELDDFDTENVFSRCREGLTKLLYVSPERLTNRVFLENMADISISFIAVDEAHCISEWGQDFRPSYQNIKPFREILPDTAVIALTATATPKVLQEISSKLGLIKPHLFQRSFRRDNIRIILEPFANKYEQVLNILKYNPVSGIVYARTRKETEELSAYLLRSGIRNVDFFHAGLSLKEKNLKQQLWINSSDRVLICTNAFGMGIDKESVRFIIHLSPPQSLENYYQEIGRAGRDGKESFAYLFYTEQELKAFDELLQSQIPSRAEYRTVLSYLYSSFQIADFDLPDETYQLHLEKIKQVTRISLGKIRNILNFLHTQEIIFYRAQKALSSLQLKFQAQELDLLANKDAYFVELLLRSFPGLSHHRILFSEENFSKKIEVEPPLLKERLLEMKRQDLVDYIDGALASIRFLKHRDDRSLNGKYWHLFEQIQKNKLQKWEEMKYYLRDTDHCKIKLILSYFGEKNARSCGKCSTCVHQKAALFGRDCSAEILELLSTNPATAEEISVRLHYFEKEDVLDNLIHLLDCGKVKMLNFRTYMLS